MFKLGDPPGEGKEEVLAGVQRHWAAQVCDEDDTTIAFAVALRKALRR